jgi:hydroxymethylpyrimidine/phosphomethylpyrimidine kinase
MMKTALTIAGSDPTGGAGLQADIRVFNHFGVYGLSVVSALTAQNTTTVNSILKVEAEFIEKQLDTLLNDIRPDAVKTGMLYSVDTIKTLVKFIKGYDLGNLVIDPVTISSTGTPLMEQGVLDALKDELFPVSKVITPNIYEASALSGMNIENKDDMEKAAKKLKNFGPDTVIITGGHFEGGKETLEMIYDGQAFHRIKGRKIKGEYHGTGCAFSAAITALLAKGTSVIEAAKKAKEFIELAIKDAHGIGKGMRLLNV